jgi:gamma-glutamylcyclotransferase (GGCT)/AIG2-like uncharacterized protein YtfP
VVFLFVYGTLKPGELSYHLCAAQVLQARPAAIEGQIYHLPLGYPAVTLEQPGTVLGTLLSFADDSILAELDDYEAHAPEVLERHVPGVSIDQVQYRREQVQTYSENLSCPLQPAWIYTMTRSQVDSLRGVVIPSGVWYGDQDYRTV